MRPGCSARRRACGRRVTRRSNCSARRLQIDGPIGGRFVLFNSRQVAVDQVSITTRGHWRFAMQASEREQPFDATSALDSPNPCVPHRVEAQAAWGPDDVAVSDGTQHLTRVALENAANRLARRLRSLGVRRDVPVGLCLPRSLELIVAALGIMKAGGAYVPMDPGYPSERLAFMLEDLAAPVVVTTSSLARRLPRGGWT